MAELDLNTGPDLPPKIDYGIGCIGAGFIMKDIHLVAYGEAGFNVVAIASRTPEHAKAAAERARRRDRLRHVAGAARRRACRDRGHRVPARPAARDRAGGRQALTREGHPRPEAGCVHARRGGRDGAALRRGGGEARRQPQHALRPVDAGPARRCSTRACSASRSWARSS